MPLSPDLPGSSKAALCVGPRAGAGPKGRALHRSLSDVAPGGPHPPLSSVSTAPPMFSSPIALTRASTSAGERDSLSLTFTSSPTD